MKRKKKNRNLKNIYFCAMVLYGVLLLSRPVKSYAGEIPVLDLLRVSDENLRNGAQQVTREQFAGLLLRFLGEYREGKSRYHIFRDVKDSSKYAYSIQFAAEKNWMSGYIDGTFRPKNKITLKDAARALVKMLSVDGKEGDSAGPSQPGRSVKEIMNLFYEYNLGDKVKAKESEALNYKEVKQLFLNMLKAKTGNGTLFGERYGAKRLDNGELDYSQILKERLKGPYLDPVKLKENLPFSLKDALIYRNGERVDSLKYQNKDVIYYDEKTKNIWIYNTQAEGILNAVEPNRRNPKQVTIDGEVFLLGTKEAKSLFGKNNKIEINSPVVLQLGFQDEVVGVQSDAMLEGDFRGVILKMANKSSQDRKENSVVEYFMTIADTSGKIRTVRYAYNGTAYKAGDAVLASGSNGTVQIKKLNIKKDALLGSAVNLKTMRIGNAELSQNVVIVNIDKETAKVIALKDLDHITLSADQILYAEKDTEGKYAYLMLKNILSSEKTHVLVTKVKTLADDSHEVTYLLNGEEKILQLPEDSNSQVPMPKYSYRLEQKENEEALFFADTTFIVRSINGKQVEGDNTYYKLSDSVKVYFEEGDGTFYLTSADKIKDTNTYYLKAFYDKNPTKVKEVFMILAKKQ